VTTNFKERKRVHLGHLKYHIHDNKALQADYDKYGVGNFVFDVIDVIGNPNDAYRQENFLTTCILGINNTICYNFLRGGNNKYAMQQAAKHHQNLLANDEAYRSKFISNCLESVKKSGVYERKKTTMKGEGAAIPRKVKNTITGEIYPTVVDAADKNGIKSIYSLRKQLDGRRKNRTHLILLPK
jgi:hypothetical protein